MELVINNVADTHTLSFSQSHEGLSSHRVLIIEDNLDSAETLKMLLEINGHIASTATSGAIGLSACASFKPTVVFCDIGLPDMTGYDVARKLRKMPETERAFLVALTGYGMDEDKNLAQEAGFDRHLTKPVDPDVIEKLLASL